jgi:ATPase family protein associated with various cellular activities (AAA)
MKGGIILPMKPNYSVRDSLPEFEEENAALSALLFEVSRKAPVHQVYYYKKDVTFNKNILKEGGKLLASTKSPGSQRGIKEAELWLYKDVYIYIRTYKGNSTSAIFINNEDDNGDSVKSVYEEFEKTSKSIEPTTKNVVKVKFWSLASYGPKYDSKFLELPTWEDITKNYSEESHDSIQNLMKLDPSTLVDGGKIILLHGPAGTGKTTLIRAIIREWKEWCDVEYIIDPEVILNSSNYLTQVVLGNDDDDDDEEMFSEILNYLNRDKKTEATSSKFRLLIFEDTEDLIASDDKGSVSASVSRLLNIGDGLLGQGLKILILITTNVKIEKLHPALVRPGRTLANIHVPKLSTNEATQWLGSEYKEATLAELYEEKNKNQIVAAKKEIELPGTYL